MIAPIEGLVVGWVDVGESDRIVRLLTVAEGRVSLSVRRARTGTGAVFGELGASVRVERGRSRGGHLVARSAERLSGPVRIRDDLRRIALLGYGCELCGALAPEGAPADKQHGLLAAWIAALESSAPGGAARPTLEAKALTFAGVAPSFTRCWACGEPLTDPAVFDAESGGAAHGRCGGGQPVSVRGLSDLERLRRSPLADVIGDAAPELPPWMLAGLVAWHLGRPLQSRALLEVVDR